MAPIALTEPEQNGHSNGQSNGKASNSKYHASSSQQAMSDESAHAAHNYHPLPVVFAKASGSSVWDPEGMNPASLN